MKQTFPKKKASDIIFLASIAIWMVLQILFMCPDSIVDDWMGWRQADTQTIARNFLLPHSNLLYPRINWGGAGPGYVESELQIYPALIALIMRFTGTGEWPGQILSLLFIVLCSLILRKMLSEEFGVFPATMAALYFLTCRVPAFLAMSVQPDALCFLLYLISFYWFVAFLKHHRIRTFYLSAGAAVLAAMVKPTALNIGIFEFLYLLMADRQSLKIKKVWAGWLGILLVFTLFILHGNNLYQQFGNTFGVLLNGDSKLPGIKNLLNPGLYLTISIIAFKWMAGYAGLAAGAIVLLSRRVSKIEWALLVCNSVALLVAMRYTSNVWYGPHYHIFLALPTVWFLAHAIKIVMTWGARYRYTGMLFILLFAVLLPLRYRSQVKLRTSPHLPAGADHAVSAMGKELSQIVSLNDLVVVKSVARSTAEDTWNNRSNNFEDPRIFYLANTRGWVLPVDSITVEKFVRYKEEGARYYIDPYSRNEECGGRPENTSITDSDRWLEKNAEKIYESECGCIYRL